MRIIVEDASIHGIPTSHYRIDDHVKRPLVVACHGFESDRFSTISDVAMQLARRGYHVMTLDAYMHGERSDERFTRANDQQKGEMIFDIIFQTVQDIKLLLTTLATQPLIETTQVGVTGISMGAMTAHLAAVTLPSITVIADMIGTPDYLSFVKDITGEEGLRAYSDKLEMVAPFNPIALYLEQAPKAVLLCHGRSDEVVPINSVNTSYKKLSTYYKEQTCGAQAKYMKYFCKHEVPTEMKRSVYKWFETHLPVANE